MTPIRQRPPGAHWGGGIRGEIDPDVAVELLKSENVDGIVVLFYSGGGKSIKG